MLIHYICFLSSHEVMVKADKGKKKEVALQKHYYLFSFVLFKSFILLEGW